jgi:hypothetical protein
MGETYSLEGLSDLELRLLARELRQERDEARGALERRQQDLDLVQRTHDLMYANLTSVQARCTELLLSVRAGTSFIFGRDSEDDKRDAVLVARQYHGSKMDPQGQPYANLHDWAVFIHSSKVGLCILGGMSTNEGKALAERSRQFDTQAEALAYGQALLKEIRDGQSG